jgi:hypothetical protein
MMSKGIHSLISTDYSLDPTDTIDRCVNLVIDKKAWTTATLDSLFPSCGATKNCDYLSHDENAPHLETPRKFGVLKTENKDILLTSYYLP